MAIDDFSVYGTSVESEGVTSINSQTDDENINLIKVYPNPNNGSFSISTNNMDKECDIEIRDATERLIYKKRIENNGI